MTIYNVKSAVVDLIDADSREQAVRKLEARLTAAGFDVYEGEPSDAFESDDQSTDEAREAQAAYDDANPTPEPWWEQR